MPRAASPSSPTAREWIDRLKIVGIDLRDPTQVIALADDVAAAGSARHPHQQRLHRPCAAAPARTPTSFDGENEPLDGHGPGCELVTFDRISEAHPAALLGSLRAHPVAHHAALDAHDVDATERWTPLASSPRRPRPGPDRRPGRRGPCRRHGRSTPAGSLPDVVRTNSWKQTVSEVDPLELLEVQLCNSVAPFLLVSRCVGDARRWRSDVRSPARRTYVVNVSAMEGQFSRRYKGPGHPHTNMAKAALNMLTRTSAAEMLEADGILMTAVDTGWITDERPHDEKLRIAEEGWHAPLDLVDGAARVYDPIVRGEAGEDLHGVFLKNFAPHPW
jgi:NAD(P)-dependent dehydrogenase (short-subunit alcohol dehydrogenase family)